MKKNVIIFVILILVLIGLYFVSQQEEKVGVIDEFGTYIGPGCEVYAGCGPTQCGNIGDEQRGSICDVRPEYQCFIGSTARCEKQPEGDCGWTQTEEFKQCVSSARASENTSQNNTQVMQAENTIDDTCLKITSLRVNQEISFPLEVKGYVDIAGATTGTCSRWTAFEGTAGTILVYDVKGNAVSQVIKINTVGDYTIGMTKWPVIANISSLTQPPITNQVSLHFGSEVVADGETSNIKILQPLIVN